MRTSKAQVRRYATELGIGVQSNSPGDGTTRYTFTWGKDGIMSMYVRGTWEAWTFLRGFEAGRNDMYEAQCCCDVKTREVRHARNN